MKSNFQKLSHSIFKCKFHIVSCPKYRYRIFKGEIAEYVNRELYRLVKQKDLVEILELSVQPDHS